MVCICVNCVGHIRREHRSCISHDDYKRIPETTRANAKMGTGHRRGVLSGPRGASPYPGNVV